MKKFQIYWLDGKHETVTGTDIADAFTQAGYGAGALGAVDFYDNGDQVKYTWNATTKNWDLIKEKPTYEELAEALKNAVELIHTAGIELEIVPELDSVLSRVTFGK